jgi:hypothetical protein
LLDDRHTELVEKLWLEMAQRFGVGNPATAVPHFSYHVSEAYDLTFFTSPTRAGVIGQS